MFLKRYFSATSSYKKTVARDCLFSAVVHDMLILNNVINNELYKQEKLIQVNNARNKLIKMIPTTTEYDIGW